MGTAPTYKITEQIPNEPLPKKAFAFLWHFCKRHKKGLLPCVFLMMFWSANTALFPYFIKMFTDAIVAFKGTPDEIWSALRLPIYYVVGSHVLMEAAMRTMCTIQIYSYPYFRADLRMQVFQYVKDHSLSYFANNFAGAIAGRIQDIPQSSFRILDHLVDTYVSIIMLFIFSVIVMWTASPLYAALMVGWCVIHILVTIAFMPLLNRRSQAQADSMADLQGRTVDMVSNMMSVRLFAKGPKELRRMVRAQNKVISRDIDLNWGHERLNQIRGFFTLVFVVSFVASIVYGYQHQWITVGDIPMVGMGCFQMIGMLWYLTSSFETMVTDYGTIQAALLALQTPHEVVDAPQAKELLVSKGEVAFQDLTFRYGKRTPLFKDLSVTIRGGESVGLVGFSGSGKTSFVNLLLRFFDPQKGCITIDGQDIGKVTQDSLRSAIAMIPQDPSLFHRSLMENIRYGCDLATEADVIEASKLAHCHDFIMALEEGYQTQVGERGIKLSGGQRQRIAIARAILKNAPILVLDEATSALDSVTERYIQESLAALMKGRTTLVVAHRLSTLASMDRLLVFDQGRIVEQGTQQELLKKKDGHFSKLWSLQNEGFLPEKVG